MHACSHGLIMMCVHHTLIMLRAALGRETMLHTCDAPSYQQRLFVLIMVMAPPRDVQATAVGDTHIHLYSVENVFS